MSSLYILRAEYEKCAPDKEKIDIIFPYTALHYITAGYGYFNGVRLGKDSFFCAKKNEKCCYYPDPQDPWSYIYIDLDGVINRNEFAKGRAFGSFPYIDEIKEVVKLFATYTNRGIDNNAFEQALIDMVFSLHDRSGQNERNESAADRHVRRIKEYIDRHFNKKVTIEEIARHFFLSRAYVRNIFFEKTGVSTKQYLQTVRMKTAASLLSDTDYKVSEIASSVGYDDVLAFSKAFKKHNGLSPAAYRKRTESEHV